MGSITRFINDDNGADLIEYALLVGLVSLAAATGLTGVATSIKNVFIDLAAKITAAPIPPAGS